MYDRIKNLVAHIEKNNWWEIIAFAFLFIGVFLVPTMIRYPLVKDLIGEYGYINYFVCISTIIFLVKKRDYERKELYIIGLWILMLIPLFYSNRNLEFQRSIAQIFSCWFPMFIILYKISNENRQKLIHYFLLAYDAFIILLFLIGIIEKFTDGAILHHIVLLFTNHGFVCKDLTFLDMISVRYTSIWGHPLTNAVLFNLFFIVNDIYYRSIHREYPRMIFFVIALFGVLLCSGKTAIVVLGLYLIISNWKEKRWLFVYIVGFVVMYFLGIFDLIIQRFTEGPLTTGRVDALKEYFSSGIYPFHFFSGYGTGMTYTKPMFHLKAGFEFPPMMFSLDYGMLFAFVMFFTVFIYFSYYMIKKKEYISWMGYSLIYAQINTYNGICLRNQDICCILSIFTMIVINCMLLKKNKGSD